MQSACISTVAAFCLLSLVSSSTVDANPVNKVLSMISKMQGEVIKEGEEEQNMYAEFAHMCQSRSHELHQEGKTSKSKVSEEQANIEKNKADSTLLQEKISSTAAAIDDAESELKKAGEIRNRDSTDFAAEEQTLATMISALERSIAIIERGGEGGASLAQVQQKRMESITSVFEAMVEASAFDSYDHEKLAALVQTADSEDASDDDEELGAPSAAAYKSQSGGAVETLGGLLEKAQKGLDDARQGETASLHSFEMQQQALTQKTKTLTKELGEAKKSLAQSSERKATAEGELETNKKDLAETEKSLEELHHECLDKANSFEESQTSRSEALKALAEAKKLISEGTGGASDKTYGLAQVSLLQVASEGSSSNSAFVQALHTVRHLALADRSEALGKLAASVEQAIKVSAASGANPFAKVKDLLESMINQLQKKAEASATKKMYCDNAMAETEASQEDKEDGIEKITIQIDVLSADSKKLKADVLRLDRELSALNNVQAEMDKLRMREKALYRKNKPVMEQGLESIKSALKILRDYYAQDDDAAGGASGGSGGSGIIGMLEVVESDFDKGLASMTSGEESAQSEYEAATQENKLARATKEQDTKYKTGEFVSLDKAVVDFKIDRTGVQDELAAVRQYFASVKKDCVAKVDSYGQRKKRRDEEILSLKEALSSMEQSAPSFFQQVMVRKTLRGANIKAHRH